MNELIINAALIAGPSLALIAGLYWLSHGIERHRLRKLRAPYRRNFGVPPRWDIQ